MTAAGGSLEDCHTNVFVLTELNGLKWKCLTTLQNFGKKASDAIEEDPILSAYGECLSQALLCAWRRKPRTSNNSNGIFDNPAPVIDSQKELWIFWYSQDEPKCIELFKSNGLVSEEYESFDVGVNYETRVLFFKALHNVIERNLMKTGYIRFGKWFTRPLDMPLVNIEQSLPQYINAINFRFFMHGENHVCVTINVQRQPTMIRLSNCHFETIKYQPVILGPWSIRAVLLPNQPFMDCPNLITPKERSFSSPKSSNFNYFSTFSGNDSKIKNENESTSFNDVQEAISKQWNDWKKFQAFPADDDDDTSSDLSDNETFSSIPKMVLVEVDGVRMFYPSCYIGVLADQMVFNTKNNQMTSGSNNATKSLSISSNCQNLSNVPFPELNLSFSEETNNQNNGNCAEDHEVEEIFNSVENLPGNSVINSLRHCKRSIIGVQAARKCFEDAALSVLLNNNCINRRFDVLSGDSLLPSSSGNVINSQLEGDTRWNFFDYLRREYCYCKMCSSNNPSTSDTTGIQLITDLNKDNCVFHRSSTILESVTPDHSPTFVEELNALRASGDSDVAFSSPSSSTSDTENIRSMWSSGVSSRPDLISGRLEFNSSNLNDSDILKILPHNKNFLTSSGNGLPPGIIKPFTPITVVTPEPDNTSNNEIEGIDANFQQKLKDFDYSYNPLKRDSIPLKSYHITNSKRKQKPLGPPAENSSLNSSIANINYSSTSQGFKSEPVSILKSLLDDSPNNNTLLKDDSVVTPTNSFNNTLDWFSRFCISKGKGSCLEPRTEPEHRKRTKRRKFGLRKSKVDEKNINLKKYDYKIPLIDYEEQLFTIQPIKNEIVYDEFGNISAIEDNFDYELLYNENKNEIVNEAFASVFEMDDTREISVELQKNAGNPILELTKNLNENNSNEISTEPMDTSDVVTDAMTAVTPPALLNNSEDYNLDQSQSTIEEKINKQSPDNQKGLNGNWSFNNYGINSSNTHFSTSSVPNHMIPFVMSDNMHILSPPASNERVEFSSTAVSTTSSSLAVSGSISSIPQQNLFTALSGSSTMIQDSLSIIYPTPPTPMQQFSPQTMPLSAVSQHIPNEQQNQLHHSLTEPALLNVGSPPSVAEILRQTSLHYGCMYDNTDVLEFPKTETYSRNLLNDDLDIETKLQSICVSSLSNSGYCISGYPSVSSRSSEQCENLRAALESRFVRDSTSLPPGYRKATSKKLSGFSALDDSLITDRKLVQALKKSEKMLSKTAFGHQNFGPMFFAHNQFNNYMPQTPQEHMNYNQYGMVNNSLMSSSMNQFGGGMHQVGFPTNGSINYQMMMAGRRGIPPQNFRLGLQQQQQQQQQQHFIQQQMINNQNIQSGMQKPGLIQQQPNFNNTNMQMYSNQFPIKQQQSLPTMDSANNPVMFNKTGNQQMSGMLIRQPSTGQFSVSGSTGSNNSIFQPLTPQPNQMVNHFGSPTHSLNLQQPLTPSSLSNYNPVSVRNSLINDSNYLPPFGSPNGSIKSQNPQRTASNLSSNSVAPMFGLMNGVMNNLMDTNLLGSNVSSVISNAPTLKFASFNPTFGLMSAEDLINIIQGVKSHVIAILLQDTVLDLHFDSVFDACPICCCNANIRTYEIGLYIKASDDIARCDEIQRKQQQNPRFMPDHWSGFRVPSAENQSKCNCGFSAVRHRYLCGGLSGLFPDDSVEACGIRPPSDNYKSSVNHLLWFNSASINDIQFMDLLRHQCLTRDFSTVISNLGDFLDYFDKDLKDNAHLTEYIVSNVDSIDVDKIMGNVISLALDTTKIQLLKERPSKAQQRPIFHSWGVQIGNSVREPKDSEYIALIREIQPILEESMIEARGSRNYLNSKKLEGPLTWRSFLLKTSKAHTQQQEDEICQVEPIPNIIVATEREPVTTNPQLVNIWEKLSLAPYDQTKDVLYIAVVPDSNVVVEKCRIFLEELSSIYDKCRFGWHVRASVKDGPRDGIIRLNHRSAGNPNCATLNFLSNFENINIGDRKVMMSRLKSFTENMENQLLQFFKTNDSIFERRAFHESVCRHSMHQNFTSLATSSDANSMPPPPIPIQSPNSVLSSASGPLSANAAIGSGLVGQMSQSISPSQQNQQQQSPASGPNSAPSVTNLSGATTLEELTLEGHISGTLTPQQLQQQQQNQASTEAEIEKSVEEMLSIENQNYLPHVVVIYIINPFSFGSDAHHPIFTRLATAALLRAYNSFFYQLNIKRRSQIQLEFINLQSLFDYTAFVADPLHKDRQTIELVENNNRDKMSAHDCLRKIAFTVYSQSRLLYPEQIRGARTKSMTRFGPASAFSDILDLLKEKPITNFFKIPSNPFILAPTKSIGFFTNKDNTTINPANSTIANSRLQLVSNEERVLFVSYCLVNDEWLCAAVTDEKGHLLDNVLINLVAVQPTNSSQQRADNTTWKYLNQSQIFDSIQRLWQYIQSVLVMDTKNWRIVIGRVGKIGHGEFKAWTETLSKRNLRAYNSSLKNGVKQEANGVNGCKACALIPGFQEIPAIISACLISTEPELNLRIFPSSVQSEGNLNLFTASVSTCSGASGLFSGSSKNTKSKSPQGSSVAAALAVADDPSITHIMVFPTILNISFEQQLGQSNQDDNDFDNYFCNKMEEDDQLHTLMNSMIGDDFDLNPDVNKIDEDPTIDNQPMATGYYISTAPALDLPDWFWSACPSARRRNPVHLKNSLHIHTGNIQQSDETATLISNKSGGGAVIDAHHPLDSTATDEVLKYVLERYNALSWMNVDFATGVRQSCLPVHIQAMLRLHKSLTILFS